MKSLGQKEKWAVVCYEKLEIYGFHRHKIEYTTIKATYVLRDCGSSILGALRLFICKTFKRIQIF